MRYSPFAFGVAFSLLLSSTLPAATLYWDSAGSLGTALGGTGNWDLVTSNWFNGTSDIAWTNSNSDDAVFTGANGTITLTTNISVGDLYFTNLTGENTFMAATGVETLTLINGSGTNIIDTGNDTSNIISGPVAGSGALNIIGTGVVGFSGSNPGFTGLITVRAGAEFDYGSDASLGAVPASLVTNQVTVDGGTLGSSASFTINANRGITVTSNGGTISVNNGLLTTGNVYSENTDVIFAGTGNLRLAYTTGLLLNLGKGRLIKNSAVDLNCGAAAPVFSALVLNGGSYSFSTSDAGLGTAPSSFNASNITLNGGSLHSSHTYTMNGNRGIFLNTNGGSIDVLTGSATLSIPGAISGPGNLEIIKGNTGVTVKITGNNSYAGTTTIDSGAALVVGNNGAAGTLGAGGTADNGTLTFNRSDKTYSYGGAISGGGVVNNSGSGTVTLTGNNSYSGSTTVSSGALFINGSSTGAGAVTVNNNSTLGGTGSISGSVTVNSGGTLSPGAAATPVGTLTINNSLNLSGNVAIAINKSLSPSNSSVVVTGSPASSGSGTVKITNLGPVLKTGDTFQLFSQPLSSGGSLLVIGGSAIWSNNLAVDGTISVASVPVPVINSVSTSGTNLLFSGTNGTFSGPYNLLSSTNISLPITRWTTVLAGSYDGSGNFSGTTGISTNPPQKFYLLQSQ